MKSRLNILFSGIILFTLSCGDGKEEGSKPSSPRIKKNTKVELPKNNEKFTRGDLIPFEFSSTGAAIDSIILVVEESVEKFSKAKFEMRLPGRKVGTWSIRAKVYCEGESETHFRKVIVLPEAAPREMTYTVSNSYPHQTSDYTQGLLIHEGFLYESTGQKGESSLKKKELKTGKTLKVTNLADQYFGEGLALINEEFYQLTWTSGQGFVYSLDLEQKRTFSYPMEGWGLTTYNDLLILTDETEKLYFIEPSSFTVQYQLEVYDDEGKVEALNELEFIDGKVWANIFQKDDIVVIDPETGEVLQRIDFSGLLTQEEAKNADVLNGIAVDPETGKIYITGKDWPKLFEITIQEKPL
ncbi:MAG: glutaminyl-peptide cyclotransferase [Bacteroidota bacterium]